MRIDPERKAEYDAENKAMWAQKQTVPNVKPGKDDRQHRTVRVRPELRPNELSHKTTLVEFRDWLVEFFVYYYGSIMQCNNLKSQQGLFLCCLDKDLKRQVQHNYMAMIPQYMGPRQTSWAWLKSTWKQSLHSTAEEHSSHAHIRENKKNF